MQSRSVGSMCDRLVIRLVRSGHDRSLLSDGLLHGDVSRPQATARQEDVEVFTLAVEDPEEGEQSVEAAVTADGQVPAGVLRSADDVLNPSRRIDPNATLEEFGSGGD